MAPTSDQAIVPTADLAALPADLAMPIDTGLPCNAPVNGAAPVMVTQAGGAAPMPKGGPALADGTYYATAAVLYTGTDGGVRPTGITLRSTSVIAGARYWYATQRSDKPGEDDNSGTYVLNGAAVTFTQLCPQMGGSNFVAFDNDGKRTVTLYTSPMQGGVAVITFTRQ